MIGSQCFYIVSIFFLNLCLELLKNNKYILFVFQKINPHFSTKIVDKSQEIKTSTYAMVFATIHRDLNALSQVDCLP